MTEEIYKCLKCKKNFTGFYGGFGLATTDVYNGPYCSSCFLHIHELQFEAVKKYHKESFNEDVDNVHIKPNWYLSIQSDIEAIKNVEPSKYLDINEEQL